MWAHEEGDVVLRLACLEVDRINTTRQIVGDAPGEIGLPAGILQIIVVEEDRPVLLRCLEVAGDPAGEMVASDGAHWRIDCAAMQSVGADVGNAVGAEIARKVPGGDHLVAAADLRRLDLAVEVPTANHALAC